MKPIGNLIRTTIHGEEGCVLHPYDDHDRARLSWVNGEFRRPDGAKPIGYPTIAWGHCIRPDDPADLRSDILQDRADALFDLDLVPYVSAVDRNAPNANEHQRAAMSSFAYNCGTGGLVASGIPAACVKGEDARPLFTAKHWTMSKGQVLAVLVKRRAREYALYVTPDTIDPVQTLAWVEITSQGIARGMLDAAHA